MKYMMLGMQRDTITSKKTGKKYKFISVGSKDVNWIGVKGESIMISEDNLMNADIQTESGELYAVDGKKYYVDIDYNNRGFIVGLHFYNQD